jgi:hypothetical protein
MKVLKGQQERQIHDLALRKDKVAWSIFLTEKLAQKQKAAQERKKAHAELLTKGKVAKTEEEVQKQAASATVSQMDDGLKVSKRTWGSKAQQTMLASKERQQKLASAPSMMGGDEYLQTLEEQKQNKAREKEASDSEDSDDERLRLEQQGSLDLFKEASELENTEIAAIARLNRKREVTIFRFLSPPLPSERRPYAPMNFRYAIRSILENGWWSLLLLATVVISCLMLALESPVEELTLIHPNNMQKIDLALFVIFVLEFIFKILRHGIFWEHPEAYFRSGWNCTDFFILTCTVLDFILLQLQQMGVMSASALSALGAVKVLRVMRPLRLINKIPSLKMLLNALWGSWEDIVNVLLLWSFVFLLFSILGVALFAGGLHSCNDSGAGTRPIFASIPCNSSTEPPASWYHVPRLEGEKESAMCDPSSQRRLAPPIFTRVQCSGAMITSSMAADQAMSSSLVYSGDGTDILVPRAWSSPPNHFDNFLAAMQTQIAIISLEKWSVTAFASSNILGIGLQPAHNTQPANFLFFFIFLLVTVFFILQLLIAVFIDAVRLQGGLSMYTNLQRSWLMFRQKIMNCKPLAPEKEPRARFRRRVWAFSRTEAFNNGTLAVIVLNGVVMATDSYGAGQGYERTVKYVNWGFTVIYIAELTIRLIAEGKRFFYNSWYLLDLLVVITSLAELLLDTNIGIKVLRLLRLSRIFRTIRIVRRFPRLFTIARALGDALPALASAVLLVLIVSFIFTCIGVQFFGGVRHGRLLDRDRNFDNSWTCMTLLFQVATGSGYKDALSDASVVWPACTKCTMCKQQSSGDWADFNDCGQWQGAGAFLGVYLLTVRYVLLNLLVAVLVDKFFAFQAELSFVLQDAHIKTYQEAWQSLDVHGDGTLPISQLRVLAELLHRLKNPLGSAMFTDEFKYRLTRIELIYNCPHYGIHILKSPLHLNTMY